MGNACYVYAIVGRESPLPAAGAEGGGAELASVPWRELAAVVGRMEDDDGAPLTVENVLRHEAVVEAARRQGPALPVRFGTVFRDAESVACALAERYEALVVDLERLGGKVEVSLTALWGPLSFGDHRSVAPPDEGVSAGRGAGARYLYARAAETRREDALRERARVVARDLDRGVGRLALERRVALLPTSRIAVRAVYLLDPAGVGAFQEAFEAIRRASGDLRLLLTGPWPPYSFVQRPAKEGGSASDVPLRALAQRMADEMGRRPG